MRTNQSSGSQVALSLAALGVVFGDIGTSPLYALRQCFAPEHGIAVAQENIIGVVSLIFWSITIIVSLEYMFLVLKADNKGEGGVLSLISLTSRYLKRGGIPRAGVLALLGIVGTSLLLSDGLITPAISVLSAVEGLQVITNRFDPYIIPIAVAVLTLLFSSQVRGSNMVGRLFGPIVFLWFCAIAGIGLISVFNQPIILSALNPYNAINFFVSNFPSSFGLMGAVFLAITGAEVLYADLGHFGHSPIRRSWFVLVYPALILNYFGQGAWLIGHPGDVENLFFRLVPTWGVYPMVALATAATIIASQAVISGAFSLAGQAVQLGMWPRVRIVHTSSKNIGQIYVPTINWALFIGTLCLIVLFRSSGNLANAYGIAVSAQSLITTGLITFIAYQKFHFRIWFVIPIGLSLLALNLTFFLSNSMKLLSGGWVVLIFAAALYILMRAWSDGRKLFQKKIQAYRLSPELFASSIALNPPHRVPGTAIFLTADPKGVPKALLHNLKHNRVLHENTVILSVRFSHQPYVDEAERCELLKYQSGVTQVALTFGFSESPDVPATLAVVAHDDVETDPMRITWFIGRETILVGKAGGMARWRKRIFALLFNNAASPTGFFNLPPDRVVELGAQTRL